MRFYIPKDQSKSILKCDRLRDATGALLDFEIVLKRDHTATSDEGVFDCSCIDHVSESVFEFYEPVVFDGHYYLRCIPFDLRPFTNNRVWIFREEDFHACGAFDYELYVIIVERDDDFVVVVRLLESRFVDGEQE